MVTITSRDPGPPPVDYIEALGRHLPRHDDPRFRHGALPARRGAGRGYARRLVAGRPGDRRGRRRRHRRGDAEDRVRQDRQISNSRRATYGYDQRIEVHGSKGMRPRRQRARDARSKFAGARASRPTACRISSWSATPPPIATSSPPSSMRSRQAQPQRPPAKTACAPRLLADAATQSAQTGQAVRVG